MLSIQCQRIDFPSLLVFLSAGREWQLAAGHGVPFSMGKGDNGVNYSLREKYRVALPGNQ